MISTWTDRICPGNRRAVSSSCSGGSKRHVPYLHPIPSSIYCFSLVICKNNVIRWAGCEHIILKLILIEERSKFHTRNTTYPLIGYYELSRRNVSYVGTGWVEQSRRSRITRILRTGFVVLTRVFYDGHAGIPCLYERRGAP